MVVEVFRQQWHSLAIFGVDVLTASGKRVRETEKKKNHFGISVFLILSVAI